MRRSLLVLLLCSMASVPARAERISLEDFESGAISDQWSGGAGIIDVEPSTTTPTNGDAGNGWSIEIDPAVGITEYRTSANFTATNELSVPFSIRVNTLPPGPKGVGVDFRSSSDQRLCFMTLDADARLRVYYADINRECAQSTNDGTTCTAARFCSGGANNGLSCDSVCTTGTDEATACPGGTCVPFCGEVNLCESTCTDATFANPTLALNTWYRGLLTMDTSNANAGDVTCGLWLDGRNRGTRTRPEGTCAGGANSGFACASNAGCPGSTCTTTIVQSANHVLLGATGALDINLDTILIERSVDTTLAMMRTAELYPTSDGSPNEWNLIAGGTGHYETLDELVSSTSGMDGATSFLRTRTSTNDDDEVFGLTDLSLGAGESIAPEAAVVVSVWGKEENNNANADKANTPYLLDASAGVITGPEYDFATVPDAWTLAPVLFATTEPNGTSWDNVSGDNGVGDVNALRVRLRNTGTFGAGFLYETTSAQVSIEVLQPLPTLPEEIEDVNGDGENTVVIVGDSRSADEALKQEVNALLDEPDNICFCAQGGKRTAHVLDGIQSIASCTTSVDMTCTVVRGNVANADIVIIDEIGINDFGQHPNALDGGTCYQSWCANNPATGCSQDSDCPGSTCGGPEHGDECALPLGRTFRKAPEESAAANHCILGTDFVAETLHVPPTPCVIGGNNCSGGPTTWPSGSCDLTSPTLGTWCIPGVFNTPGCPGGYCVHRNSLSYLYSNLTAIVDALLARTGSQKTRVVLVAPPPPNTSGIQLCTFKNTKKYMLHQAAWTIAFAKERGLAWIDMKGHFRDNCPDHDSNKCHRDQAHYSTEVTPGTTPNTFGDREVARVMADCLEQVPNPWASCGPLRSTPTPTPGP